MKSILISLLIMVFASGCVIFTEENISTVKQTALKIAVEVGKNAAESYLNQKVAEGTISELTATIIKESVTTSTNK